MQVDCTNNPCGCSYNGRTIDIGATFNKDECNTCSCMSNGQVCSSLFYVHNIFFLQKNALVLEFTQSIFRQKYSVDISQNLLMDMNQSQSIAFKMFFSFVFQWLPSFQLDCSNNPVPCNCKYQGQVIPLGTKVQKQCNTCECKSNGQLDCSQNPCSCQYQGMTYTIGQEFDVVGKPCTKCRQRLP